MDTAHLLADLGVIALLVTGISRFRTPAGARFGNHAAAVALLAAIALVLVRAGVRDPWTVGLSSAAGALLGVLVAARVRMTGIPALVAFQHGMGGVAAVLVSAVELTRGPATFVAEVSGQVGLVLGAATFSASLLAAAKLGNHVGQAPTRLRGHNAILLALITVGAALSVHHGLVGGAASVIASVAVAAVFGAVFAMRIGGADMPVLISFLNATAGLAAAFCGVTIENRLLIVAGATVASSGSILTIMMCRAMNRSLAGIFVGGPIRSATELPAQPAATRDGGSRDDRLDAVAKLALHARTVIVVPGYGMALAHAQFEVVRLTRLLETIGKEVRFAIHPVAGRMPGHMNVLLAEAKVPYEQLLEMEQVNDMFDATDVALVIGANDVVNPAAKEDPTSPIYGMPILDAEKARLVVILKRGMSAGFAGIDNALFYRDNARMLFGDAKKSLARIAEALKTV
jgi:NAD/NADP transhydrogenase beta subunit